MASGPHAAVEMRRYLASAAALLLLCASCRAEELRGKIIRASGQQAEIKLESALQPSVGDKTTVYFRLPVVDEEVLVGTGKVTSVTGEVVSAAIDDLKGTLQKDQLVRIDAKPKSSSQKTALATPSPTRSPVYTPPPDYVAKLGTAASYNCDDGSGDTLSDNSNNGRPMKLHGGLTFAAGKKGTALNFHDSVNFYAIREQDDTIFNLSDRDFTIELYGNFRAFAHEQVLLEKFSGKAGPGWTLTLLERTKLHFFAEGAGAFTAPVQLKPGQWYRLAVERRSSRLQMFVNDAVVLDQPIKGAITDSPNPLLLGRRNQQDGRGFPVNGLIDDIRIDVVPPRRE